MMWVVMPILAFMYVMYDADRYVVPVILLVIFYFFIRKLHK